MLLIRVDASGRCSGVAELVLGVWRVECGTGMVRTITPPDPREGWRWEPGQWAGRVIPCHAERVAARLRALGWAAEFVVHDPDRVGDPIWE